jgi:hypothetical protein
MEVEYGVMGDEQEARILLETFAQESRAGCNQYEIEKAQRQARRLAQAEISFKAGQDSVFDSMPENLPPLLETAHRTGIKEVVEWIQKEAGYTSYVEIIMKSRKGQAKLKEWFTEEQLKELGL